MPPQESVHDRAAENVDVLASLLDVYRLTTVVAGRIDLAPPWRVDCEPTTLLVVLVQATGETYLVPALGAEPIVTRPGDVVIRPHGAGGYLHDGSDPPNTAWTLTLPPTGTATPQPLRLTQGHPGSSFVCCLMQMSDAPRVPLWDSLPTVIHVAGDGAGRTGPLRHVADTMIEESASPGPASTRLMSRLAEILLILALRLETRDSSGRPGLRALADPLIAPAITLIHADPGHSWSVGSLASACGLSRSAFAARFAEAVGEAPHSYLVRWRMATAAKLLATTDMTVARVAAAVGYISEAAFRRAFAGHLGTTPREYHKRHR
ncbi:MAG TPA: AraC family transcriptional regulator [Amycolatopsis sp.]|uniref:AraC family transcriptional regulator n=1 Tax=Amycolatopsis sp. TaxID=37632 RepID=UPI002B48DA17|nr:AraC family transcriptional regulator [Amycolatopsis sp.]HKS50229.1 AraC family transcriptional regulator [Amycolatopsis sp.]